MLRVRPKAMTVAVVLTGLFPVMIGHDAGSEGHEPDRRREARGC